MYSCCCSLCRKAALIWADTANVLKVYVDSIEMSCPLVSLICGRWQCGKQHEGSDREAEGNEDEEDEGSISRQERKRRKDRFAPERQLADVEKNDRREADQAAGSTGKHNRSRGRSGVLTNADVSVHFFLFHVVGQVSILFLSVVGAEA